MSVHLLIETSGRGGFVGLVNDDRILQTVVLDETRRHVRDLSSSIKLICDHANISLRVIASVIVSTGPGSYTGLRVGITSAKTLAYAVGCPLIAVPTFRAIVETVPLDVVAVEIVADALQGHLYHQQFEVRDGEWIEISQLLIVDSKSHTFVGAIAGPWATTPDAVKAPTPDGLWQASRKIAPLSREGLFALEPLYLRGSSAEEKWKAQSPLRASSAS